VATGEGCFRATSTYAEARGESRDYTRGDGRPRDHKTSLFVEARVRSLPSSRKSNRYVDFFDSHILLADGSCERVGIAEGETAQAFGLLHPRTSVIPFDRVVTLLFLGDENPLFTKTLKAIGRIK